MPWYHKAVYIVPVNLETNRLKQSHVTSNKFKIAGCSHLVAFPLSWFFTFLAQIPDAEKKEIQDKLTASARESAFNVEYEKYYKVSFLEALDLVSSRRVYVSNGFAYVPHSELVVLILTQYRMHLSKALAVSLAFWDNDSFCVFLFCKNLINHWWCFFKAII